MKKLILIPLICGVASGVYYFTKERPAFRLTTDSKLAYFFKKRGIKKEDYKRYLNAKDEYGCTLKDVMAQAIKDYNVDTRLGVKLCSPEDYNGVFGAVIDKLIVWYHKVSPDFRNASDSDVSKISSLELDPDHKHIISTRVRFARNIAENPFRKAQDLQSTLKTEEIVSSALSKLSGELKGEYRKIPEMTEEEKNSLVQQHLLFADISKSESMKVSGIYKDFTPQGSGIFMNENKTFVAWVNEEDHLRIISIQQNGDIKSVFSLLVKASEELEKQLTFTKDERHGYLNSCPSNIGTGMRASFLVRLPHLANKKGLLDEVAKRNGLDIRSSSGEEGSADDGIFDVSNEARIGGTEVELINKLILGTAELLQEEKKMESNGGQIVEKASVEAVEGQASSN